MAKTFTDATMTGDAGIALIHRRTSEMGFAWHPRGTLDAGIDGEIELRDPATGAALNKILFVQSKASERPFPGETDTSFHYLCRPQDIEYWLEADVPVLLICSHPSKQEAWWANVTEWFTDPARRLSRKVEFDKLAQRFDGDAANMLLSVGAPKMVSALATIPSGETLTSNLLHVTSLPPVIYVAPGSVSSFEQARVRLRANKRQGNDFLLFDGCIHSFRPLDKPPFDVLCDGTPEQHESREWSDTQDGDVRYRFIRLMNMLFSNTYSRDLVWNKNHRFHYFRPRDDLRDRVERTSGRGKGRTVVKAYPRQDDPSQVSTYRHYALRARFVPLGKEWYLALNPDYHFTRDGFKESKWAGDWRAGIKRRERNPAVRSLVGFWARWLVPQATLLDPHEDRSLRFGQLLNVRSDKAFADPTPAAALYSEDADEAADSLQLFLP